MSGQADQFSPPMEKLDLDAAALGHIAHDLNNLLMLICSHAELLGLSYQHDVDVQMRVKKVVEAVALASELTSRLQAASRPE